MLIGYAIWGVGFLGGVFICYGIISETTKQPWPPLEKVALWLSSFFTVLGTVTTAASIYFYSPQTRPPEANSLYVTAPVVIVVGVAALYFLSVHGSLPPVVTNGFALLAIAGGLARIHPRLRGPWISS
jgi:hypothetical protein